MTLKNIPITIGLALVTISQLAFGICLVTLAARKIGETKPCAQKVHFSSGAPTYICV